MKTFILIRFAYGAQLVWIYGTITAANANAAAKSISSKVIDSSGDGALRIRHRLKESEVGRFAWFLEEIEPISSRPAQM